MPDSETEIFHDMNDAAENSVAIEVMLDDVQDNPNALADGRAPPAPIVDEGGNAIVTDDSRDVAEQVNRDVAQADTSALERQYAWQAQVASEAQEMAQLKAIHSHELAQRDAEYRLIRALLGECNDPAMWHQGQNGLAVCAEQGQRHAQAILQINQRAFEIHAQMQDAMVIAARPELGAPQGQQRTIDNTRLVFPIFSVDPDWFYQEWCRSPALRDGRAGIYFHDMNEIARCLIEGNVAGAMKVVGKWNVTRKRAKPKAQEEEKAFSPADAIAEREANAEWADANIEEILGAA